MQTDNLSNLRQLGRTPLHLSTLGFGGAPLGNLFTAVDESDAVAALDAAWELGVRYFDTAPLYGLGLSEVRLGRALAHRPRAQFCLSTKVGRLLDISTQGAHGGLYVDTPSVQPRFDYSYDGCLRSIEASLRRLCLDRIDIVFIHDVDSWTHGAEQVEPRFLEAMNGAYRALEHLRKSAVIGAIGVGVNEWQICERFLEAGDFDVFLLAGRYTLLEQEAVRTFLPACKERGAAVVIGGPYNTGILATGATPDARYNYHPADDSIKHRVRHLEDICAAHRVSLPAAALQFPLFHPSVTSVIPGGRNAREVRSNAAFMTESIPPAFWQELKTRGLLDRAAPIDLPRLAHAR